MQGRCLHLAMIATLVSLLLPAMAHGTHGQRTHATINSGPPNGGTSGPGVVFTFSADLPGNTFECRLDVGTTAGTPRACDDGEAVYTGLSGGPHTFWS